MNKIKLLILLSLSVVVFAACKSKDNSEDLLKPYLGEYTVTTNYSIPVTLPVVGNYDYSDTRVDEGTITLGQDDELIVTLGSIETKGFVDSKGNLHLEPILTRQSMDIASISTVDADVYVTFPTISKPVDGKMSWTANLDVTASIEIPIIGNYDLSAQGTADQEAVKK